MATAAHNLEQLSNRKTPTHWYATGFAAVALDRWRRACCCICSPPTVTASFATRLYYIACSRHLDWGYVDMPPFIPAVTWLFTTLFGPSLFVIRLIPAIAGCGAIALTGYQAYQFGGRRFAMALAALAMAVSAVFVINGHLLGTNDFEALFWMGCASIVIRIIQTGNQKLWLWFGVLAGVGLHEQVFDGRLRAGHRRRITVHAGAQGLRAQVDLDRRRTGISDFPAEPAVECPPRLAVRAVDAQHPRQRPRRRAESGAIHPAADPDGEPLRACRCGWRDWAGCSLAAKDGAIAFWAGPSWSRSPSSWFCTARITTSRRHIPCCSRPAAWSANVDRAHTGAAG